MAIKWLNFGMKIRTNHIWFVKLYIIENNDIIIVSCSCLFVWLKMAKKQIYLYDETMYVV